MELQDFETVRVRNPFDYDGESPITAAVMTEGMRLAEVLFKNALGDTSRPSSSASDAISAAICGDIWDEDIPAIIVSPTPSSKPMRSKTDAKLSPPEGGGSRIIRAASARAVVGRQKSERYMSLVPSTPTSQRPASSRSISARAGAIAAGDDDAIEEVISKSRSIHFIGNHIAENYIKTQSPLPSPRTQDAETAARCDRIFEMIVYKFRKHVVCEECKPGKMCMCRKGCEEEAVVFSQRFGRLGNSLYIRPGFYAMGHLVDAFIDAYDEEKRLRDIDRASFIAQA